MYRLNIKIIVLNKIKRLFLLLMMFLVIVSCDFMKRKENLIPINQMDKTYDLELVAEGVTVPWGIDWIADSIMLVTDINGKLYKVVNKEKTEIKTAFSIYRNRQGGLLDVAVHPNYVNNGWIYLTYADRAEGNQGGNTALVRAKIRNDSLINVQQLYRGEENSTHGAHFGSRICFDDKGYVYFSIGDRGDRYKNPQDVTLDGGKIYRLQTDGQIPVDNPFIHQSGSKQAIFSYGHRNPQGLFFHPKFKQVWSTEHGPKGGDEINIIEKGANYGWPIISYGVTYKGVPLTLKTRKKGMQQPIHYWIPSIAPSSFEYVSSNKYPDFEGKYLVGSLKFRYLEVLTIEKNRVVKREQAFKDIGRVRCVKQGPDGCIYFTVEHKGVFKIKPL